MRAVSVSLLRFSVLIALAGCARGGAEDAHDVLADSRTTPPCEGETDCEIVTHYDAGHDATGNALTVWETTRGRRDVETGELAVDEDLRACELKEYWLERDGRYSLTLSLCNDGYGASGAGDDTLSFADNRMIHDQYGGSAWRWNVHREIELAPRRVLSALEDGNWNLGPNTEHLSIDYSTFAGRVDWFSPACDLSDAEREALGIGEIPPVGGHAYVLLPALRIDDGFDPARMDASQCSTRIDGGGERGFLLDGEPAGEADAYMDVVTSEDGTITLLVHDDVVVPSGASRGDVVRVIFGAHTPSYFEQCLDDDVVYSSVFLGSSGQVLEGDASALAQVAGRRRDGFFVRITLPYEELRGAVTITYSDVDTEGAAPERVFATSAFSEADPWSLGTRRAGYAESTRCVVTDGQLVRRHTEERVRPHFEP